MNILIYKRIAFMHASSYTQATNLLKQTYFWPTGYKSIKERKWKKGSTAKI